MSGDKTFIAFFFVILVSFLSILISVAFMTLIERKLIASIQNRKGPNYVGALGIFQPFADALKLLMKESILPRNARLFVFLIAPLVSLFFAMLSWAFIPFNAHSVLVDTNLALLFIFSCSTLHIYGVLLAGWASGSRYSFLGAIRSTAQLVAYDITIALVLGSIVLHTKTMNLSEIVKFQDENG